MSESAPAKRQSIKLTPRELETVVAALQNLKGGEIKINYAGMAETLGLKNDKSATAVWCAVKRKLFNDGVRGGGAKSNKPSDVNGIIKSRKKTTATATAPAPAQPSSTQQLTGTTPLTAIQIEEDHQQ